MTKRRRKRQERLATLAGQSRPAADVWHNFVKHPVSMAALVEDLQTVGQNFPVRQRRECEFDFALPFEEKEGAQHRVVLGDGRHDVRFFRIRLRVYEPEDGDVERLGAVFRQNHALGGIGAKEAAQVFAALVHLPGERDG